MVDLKTRESKEGCMVVVFFHSFIDVIIFEISFKPFVGRNA